MPLTARPPCRRRSACNGCGDLPSNSVELRSYLDRRKRPSQGSPGCPDREGLRGPCNQSYQLHEDKRGLFGCPHAIPRHRKQHLAALLVKGLVVVLVTGAANYPRIAQSLGADWRTPSGNGCGDLPDFSGPMRQVSDPSLRLAKRATYRGIATHSDLSETALP